MTLLEGGRIIRMEGWSYKASNFDSCSHPVPNQKSMLASFNQDHDFSQTLTN